MPAITGFIEDRAVNFVHSMGFTVMADRTVWPPFLSRDRKYMYLWWSAWIKSNLFILILLSFSVRAAYNISQRSPLKVNLTNIF